MFLDRLLNPQSVVIVGASATPGALGNSVLRNLENGRFSGDIHLLNPKRSEIDGRPCFNNIHDLPDDIDAAVLAIPKVGVIPSLKELAKKNVGGAIIFSAGFAEEGRNGLVQQEEIRRIALDSGMAVEGPNCLGFVNNRDGVALTFVSTPAANLGDGNGVGIVSQSGAMAAVLSVTLAAKDLAVTLSVSTGNEAATSVEDYIEYLLEDPQTLVISMIVEHFRYPQNFLKLARKANACGKTIVLLHPGKSDAARESAATHTGAMAGDYAVMRVHVENAGVIVADTLEELADITDLVFRAGHFDGRGIAVLTESGAYKALTLDLAEEVGLSLPVLSDDDSPTLRKALPDFVPVSNPIDLTAQALIEPELYQHSLKALNDDDRIGGVLFSIIQTDPGTCGRKLPSIIKAIKSIRPVKPVIYSGIDDGAIVPEEYLVSLRELGVPCFPSSERAVRALSKLVGARRESGRADIKYSPKCLDLPSRGGVIPEYLSKDILRSAGIKFPTGKLAKSEAEAVKFASELGFPVVMKGQSSELSHKSDAGAVRLNLGSVDDVKTAYKEMLRNIEDYAPGIDVDGILIEKMSGKGIELILGAKRDKEWGPIILVGFGGVQAELFKDFIIFPPGLNVSRIKSELLALKSAPLLTGFRGSNAVDMDALINVIKIVGQIMLDNPRLIEIDLNPVVVREKGEGIDTLDALIVLE